MAYGNVFIVDDVKYRKGKKIGSGGNGFVFNLKQLNGVTKNGLVVKQLRNDFDSEQVTEQRKKRFRKEIETVLNIQDDIVGILPRK